MSASNWDKCPKCHRDKEAEVIRLKNKMSSLYGIIPAEEYMKLALELEGAVREAEQPTGRREYNFREDYEIYGADEGTVIVSYSGRCSDCGIGLSFKYEHPFWPPDTSRMQE